MTRTARAAYPRAVIKDRSESRTGIEGAPRSMRKSGAGQHNWGSLADERQIELAALEDASLDEEESGEMVAAQDLSASTVSMDSSPSIDSMKPSLMVRSNSTGMSQEEIEKARQFRTNAFKKTGEVDLSAIARTSAALRSSPPFDDNAKRLGQDNKNNVNSIDLMV